MVDRVEVEPRTFDTVHRTVFIQFRRAFLDLRDAFRKLEMIHLDLREAT